MSEEFTTLVEAWINYKNDFSNDKYRKRFEAACTPKEVSKLLRGYENLAAQKQIMGNIIGLLIHAMSDDTTAEEREATMATALDLMERL